MSVAISLSITGDETPTAVTLLTLKRADTGTDIDPSDWSDAQGDFTQDGDTWSISFTAPSAGLTYSYTYRLTWTDGTHDDEGGTLTDYAASYEGDIITEAELRLFMGTQNASEMLDGDGDGNADSGAARQAVDAAEAEALSILSGGQYLTPLEFADVIDPALKMHVLALAAYWANAKRPMSGQQQPGVGYATVRKNAIDWLEDVREGERTIAGATLATIEPAGGAGDFSTVKIEGGFGYGTTGTCDEFASCN
jgi:phage gp36-like protein